MFNKIQITASVNPANAAVAAFESQGCSESRSKGIDSECTGKHFDTKSFEN